MYGRGAIYGVLGMMICVCGGCGNGCGGNGSDEVTREKMREEMKEREEEFGEEEFGEEEFRDGDLVLRCGNGLESVAVTLGSKSEYSHIGILLYDSKEGVWHVIHAVPKEVPNGCPEYIKNEPIGEFYSPERAIKGAWLRIKCPDETARKAALYCLQKYEEHVTFDNDYLLLDTTQMYCSELVWQAYLHQGIDVSDGVRHYIPRIISGEGKCIYPNDIENGSNTLYVKHLKTKTL